MPTALTACIAAIACDDGRRRRGGGKEGARRRRGGGKALFAIKEERY